MANTRKAPRKVSPAQIEAAKAAVEELHAKLTDGLNALVSSDDWAAYLNFQAKFHDYSAQNTFLIYIQNPEATRVMGYGNKDKTSGWLSVGRQVRAGEKAIKVFAPSTKRNFLTAEQAASAKAKGRAVRYTKDGTPYTSYTVFRVVSVFDISQTEGDPVPDPVALLTGDRNETVWTAFEKALINEGWTVSVGHINDDGTNGVTELGRKAVTISDKIEGAQQVKTLVHEWAHTQLHADVNYLGDRGRWEVEAESVAYLTLAALGIDSATYSLGYVAHWSNGDGAIVKDTAARVVKTAQAAIELVEAATE